MSFKDKLVYCETARRTFVHTIQQQRQAAAGGDNDNAAYCDICRAQIQLAAVPHDEKTDGALPISALVREGCAFSSMGIGAAPGISTSSYGSGRATQGGGGGGGRGGHNRRGPSTDRNDSGGQQRESRGGRRGGGDQGGAKSGEESREASGGRGRRGGGGSARSSSGGGGRRGGGGGGGGGRGGGGRGGQRGGRRGGGRGPRRESQPQTDLRIRQEGTVKWFNYEKGYGFIAQDDGSDLFVHSSSILSKEQTELHEGQPVEYEVENAPRGAQAVYVIPLS